MAPRVAALRPGAAGSLRRSATDAAAAAAAAATMTTVGGMGTIVAGGT
eukprot:COSAG01_NODE_51747_length_352_cov_0.822134_1_plen_47_part_10